MATVSWLLDGIITYFVVVLVIVFQQDIRRGLMRLGKNVVPMGRTHELAHALDEVIAAANHLAKARIGGIVVFEREADITDFVELGQVIDARVSRRLLVSLFVPSRNNELHDGAVIIDKSLRIRRAGGVLPLSTSSALAREFGTRYRAALGITEETDAVSLVISEERGEISVCFKGNIARDLEPDALRQALGGLISSRQAGKPDGAGGPRRRTNRKSDCGARSRPSETDIVNHRQSIEEPSAHGVVAVTPQGAPERLPVLPWIRTALFQHGRTKFVALVLSIAAFVFVKTDKDKEITVIVPVRYQFPENRELTTEPVDRVHLVVRGPRRRIDRFDRSQIEPVEIDLTNARSGKYVFQEDMFVLPPWMELVFIDPGRMRLQFENKITKKVRIEVVTSGNAARNHRLESVSSTPAHVTIRGAQSIVGGISEVLTQEVDLASHSKSFQATVDLVRPKQSIEIVDPKPVIANVSIVPK